MRQVTFEFLRENYEYDPRGFFINKKTGREIRGTMMTHGYRAFAPFHKQPAKLYHRMIWLWHHGELPAQLDHINRNRADNRIENLRPCSAAQNQAHRPGNRTRKNGLTHKGVDLSGKKLNRFRARIIHLGKYIHLGLFPTEEAAGAAYIAAASRLSGEFAMGGVINGPS